MNRRFLIALSVTSLLGLIISMPLGAKPYAETEELAGRSPTISMDFQDADLKNVLKMFSQQSGLNFVASEEVKDKKVTLYLDNVLIQDALDNIIEANGLIYEQAPDSDIFIVKEKPIPKIRTITRVYPLDYCQVYIEEKEEKDEEKADEEINLEDLEGMVDIIYLLKGLLTEDGKISVDRRTNSLIITDIPSRFDAIENTIASLDVPIPEVMIEVEVIETELEALERLGFKWGGDDGEIFSFELNDADLLPYHVGKWHAGFDGGPLGPGTFTLNNIKTTLEALVTEGKATILARPRILTLNNEAAKINIDSNDAIEVTKEWETTEFGERESFDIVRPEKDERPGVSLKVTPIINKDNLIKMIIEPRVITKTLSDVSTEDNIIYDLHFRTAKTTVIVGDGQTVIIGGLISKKGDEDLQKVPFLGNIPILGKLFSYKYVEDINTELVFFITPHIVRGGVVFSEINQPRGTVSQPSKPSRPDIDIQRGFKSERKNYKSSEADVEKERAIEEAIRQFLTERALVKTESAYEWW
jgi:type IV pilus assembly protein PilQ